MFKISGDGWPKGMYNGSSEAVSTMYILQKAPHQYEETGSASSHETTGKSRCPRLRRLLQQRCTDAAVSNPEGEDPVRAVQGNLAQEIRSFQAVGEAIVAAGISLQAARGSS